MKQKKLKFPDLPGGLPCPVTACQPCAVLAIVGKFVGAWLGAKEDRMMVGVGMVPRGEVGIIIAGLGFQFKVIGKDVYSLLVGMSLITSIVAAPIMKSLVKRNSVKEQLP